MDNLPTKNTKCKSIDFEEFLKLLCDLSIGERNKNSEDKEFLREYTFKITNGLAKFKPERLNLLPKDWYIDYYENDNESTISFILRGKDFDR